MSDLTSNFFKNSISLLSLEDTLSFSQDLFQFSLKHPQVVFLLDGDLGLGKTTFVKSFLSFSEVQDPITSPSYSLMNYYPTFSKDYYHMDLYRLSSEWDFEELGAEEILSSQRSFCFLIEWASLFPSLWQGYKNIKFIQLNFYWEGEEGRKVDITVL